MCEIIEEAGNGQEEAGAPEKTIDGALYVYGLVKSGLGLDWRESGLNHENVYTVSEGKFSALVHNCKEEPYSTKDLERIKELVIVHNKVLERAMMDFKGVIPLRLNTIIKRGNNSAKFNVKKWLNDDQERLEKIWNKIKGKREYGVTIYYGKEKLLQEVSAHQDVNDIKKISEEKGPGLSYLLQNKAKSRMKESFQEKLIKLKQDFFDGIKEIAKDTVENPSRVSLDEEKDLLLRLSVLAGETEISKIKEFLKKRAGGEGDFPFQVAGPFAPYSFVEDQ